MGNVETIVGQDSSEQNIEREFSVYELGERTRISENEEGLEVSKEGQSLDLSAFFNESEMFEVYIRAKDEEGENIGLLNSQGRFVNGAKSFREKEIVDTYFEINEKKKKSLTIGEKIPILFGDKKIQEVVFVRKPQKRYLDPDEKFSGMRFNNIKEDFIKYFQYTKEKPNKKLPVGSFKYSPLEQESPFVTDFASSSRMEKEKILKETRDLAKNVAYTLTPSELGEGIEGVKQVHEEFVSAQKDWRLQSYLKLLQDDYVSSEQKTAFLETLEDKMERNLLYLSEFLSLEKTDVYGEALKDLNEAMTTFHEKVSSERKRIIIEKQGESIKKAYEFLCKRYPALLDSLDFRLDDSSKRPCCRRIYDGQVIELPGENAQFFYQSYEERHPIVTKMLCDWLGVSKEKLFENNAELFRTFVFLHEVGHAHHLFYDPKDFQKVGYKSQEDILELFLKEYNNGLLPNDESSQNLLRHKSKERERYADRFATKLTRELMAQKVFD